MRESYFEMIKNFLLSCSPSKTDIFLCECTQRLSNRDINLMRMALDEKKHIGVIFTDFKKAFDSICHKTIALTLQVCGISGTYTT